MTAHDLGAVIAALRSESSFGFLVRFLVPLMRRFLPEARSHKMAVIE
jgi:hypothetical protein